MLQAKTRKWLGLFLTVEQGSNFISSYLSSPSSTMFFRNKRLEYAKNLSMYIPVDIYGGCGNMSCPRSNSNCFSMLDKQYKFYLAFENSNCRDYITEKFFVNSLG